MLYRHSYLDRPIVQVERYAASRRQPYVYGLGNRGAKLIAQLDGATPAKVHWTDKNREAGRPFVNHTLLTATIEGWLATEPQITALAIVRRLGEIDPVTFRDNQHSIVQRLLRSLRSKAAKTALAGVTDQVATVVPAPPGSVDGAANRMLSAPPTAPSAEQVATKASRRPDRPSESDVPQLGNTPP